MVVSRGGAVTPGPRTSDVRFHPPAATHCGDLRICCRAARRGSRISPPDGPDSAGAPSRFHPAVSRFHPAVSSFRVGRSRDERPATGFGAASWASARRGGAPGGDQRPGRRRAHHPGEGAGRTQEDRADRRYPAGAADANRPRGDVARAAGRGVPLPGSVTVAGVAPILAASRPGRCTQRRPRRTTATRPAEPITAAGSPPPVIRSRTPTR